MGDGEAGARGPGDTARVALAVTSICFIAGAALGLLALIAPALPPGVAAMITSTAQPVFAWLILAGCVAAIVCVAPSKRKLLLVWLVSSAIWIVSLALFFQFVGSRPDPPEGIALRLPIREALGIPRVLSAQAGVLIPTTTLLILGSFSVLVVKVIAESSREARARRDELAALAAQNPIAPGTPIHSIPDSHPWIASLEARRLKVPVLLEPPNPWWRDAPTMNEAWWAIATGPEDDVSRWSTLIRGQSRSAFDEWLHQTQHNDPATYAAYQLWRQNEALLAEQRRAAAQRERMIAGQQALQAEQRRTTEAAQRAAATTAAASHDAQRRWSSDQIRRQNENPR